MKGGGLQQDCRAGTNTGRAGGGAEGNGRMRAEHRVVLLREEPVPGTPIPTHLGCHEHHLATEATARDSRGI